MRRNCCHPEGAQRPRDPLRFGSKVKGFLASLGMTRRTPHSSLLTSHFLLLTSDSSLLLARSGLSPNDARLGP